MALQLRQQEGKISSWSGISSTVQLSRSIMLGKIRTLVTMSSQVMGFAKTNKQEHFKHNSLHTVCCIA